MSIPKSLPPPCRGIAQFYPGHEVVGEVIEVGEDVQHLHVGDRVALQYSHNCLSAGAQPLCRSCASGNYNLCERGSFPGPQQIGGGWSEEGCFCPNNSSFMSRTISMMSRPSCWSHLPWHCMAFCAICRSRETGCSLVGAGTIGLLTLKLVRALMPDVEISVQAGHTYQVEQATRLGAEHIIYGNSSYEDVQRATGATVFQGLLRNRMLLGGYDVIYDTIGTKRTLNAALRWTRAGGTLVLVGSASIRWEIDLTPIWYQEINLVGSLAHGMDAVFWAA